MEYVILIIGVGLLTFCLLLALTVLVHIFFLVPYVPTNPATVRKMIRLAKLKSKETIYDLGCGDGRLLFAAEEQKKVFAVGFEIAPIVYLLAHLRRWLKGSAACIYFQNFFSADFRKAQVIFCYLLPHVMPKLVKKIKRECQSGTRIISNSFHIPGLPREKIFERQRWRGIPRIYVYTI